MKKVRIPIAALGAIAISLFSQTARADMITITGNLTSDGSAVGSGDPVISDPSTPAILSRSLLATIPPALPSPAARTC